MRELAKFVEGDRFDGSELVDARDGPKPKSVEAKMPIEHQRPTLSEVQNGEGDLPPPVHEGQDVTSLHLRIGEKDFSIGEPALMYRQLRDHSLPRRKQKGGLPSIRRAGIPWSFPPFSTDA